LTQNLTPRPNRVQYLHTCFSLILLLTSLLTFTGCPLFPKEEEILAPPLKEPPQITYDTILIKKGLFEKKVECTGYFISVNQRNLCFTNRGGRLKALRVVPGDVVKKGDIVAELFTENLESQIKMEEIILRKTQMVYEAAVASQESKYNIERADLDMQLEKIKLEDLKRELSDSRLVAPLTGTVDYITEAKEGDYVEAFKTIVRVADVNNLQVGYSDSKVEEFRLGMRVEVEVDNGRQGAYKLTGKVVMTPENAPSDADEKTKRAVRISVAGIPKFVTIGTDAHLVLLQDRKQNVIVIPKNLIHNLGARKYVHILDKGLKKERDIETGAENQTEIEIAQGLNVGELLVDD
jgi:multidrug efflux pump subunit AcrA (membrane-fusion protein)